MSVSILVPGEEEAKRRAGVRFEVISSFRASWALGCSRAEIPSKTHGEEFQNPDAVAQERRHGGYICYDVLYLHHLPNVG
jgi:hypothetical protein